MLRSRHIHWVRDADNRSLNIDSAKCSPFVLTIKADPNVVISHIAIEWDRTFARPVMSSMPMPSCVSSTVIWRRGQTESQCFRFPADLNSNACNTSSGSAKSYLRHGTGEELSVHQYGSQTVDTQKLTAQRR